MVHVLRIEGYSILQFSNTNHLRYEEGYDKGRWVVNTNNTNHKLARGVKIRIGDGVIEKNGHSTGWR